MPLRPRALLVLALGLSACARPADPPPDGAEAWRTLTQTDSAGTVLGTVVIRDADPVAGERLPPSLLLRCSDDAFAVYIDWRTPLSADPVPVTYALDDAPEQTARWTTSADSTAAGLWTAPDAARFVREMTRHERMRVAVETAAGAETWDFPLGGLAEASGPVREMCAGSPDDSLASR